MKFYLYAHSRNDTGEVFYIGKGAWRKRGGQRHTAVIGRSQFWKSVVAKAGGFTSHIIGEFEDEKECFWAESAMIKYHGRRDQGNGTLVNHTDGGEGCTGSVRSEEAKQRQSAALSGRRLSPEHRSKLSAAKSGLAWTDRQRAARMKNLDMDHMSRMRAASNLARGVAAVSVVDGTMWPSVSCAARAIGISPAKLNAAFRRSDMNLWGVRLVRDAERMDSGERQSVVSA